MTTPRYGNDPILARYRPGGTFWFLFLMIGGLAAAFPILSLSQGGKSMPLLYACGMAAFTMLSCFCPVLFFVRVIDADAAGLTCWDWRGKRRIRWEDVQDYYLHLPRERNQSATIQTSKGRFRISDIDRGYDEIRQCVREHTGHLPVKEWEVLGCRPNDPATIVFGYTWRVEAVFSVLSAAMTVALTVGAVKEVVRSWALMAQFAGVGWAIAFVILVSFIPVLFGLMTWSCLMVARKCWERRNDRVSVTSRGICYESAREMIEAPWLSGVTWHSVQPERQSIRRSKLAVVTSAGSFEVSSQIGVNSTLETYRLLRHLLERYAGPDTQPLPEEGVIADATKRWADRIAAGARVHHYRTPVNRALLTMACGYASVFPVAALAGYAAGTLTWSTARIVTTTLGFVTIAAFAQWRYRTAAVITDDTGIRAYTVFGERRLRWEDITEYGNGEHLATIRDNYGAIRFWLTISEVEQLQKTIQERAINSKTREWKL